MLIKSSQNTKVEYLNDKLSCMASGQTTVRLDPRVKARLVALVDEGRYPSISVFITEAILEKFGIEGIAVEGEVPPDPIQRYFNTPEGREVLRQLIREERE